ncbi:MAG TPA: hypothetical protein EYP62_03845 [Kiritimatiellae bacterium]|nr:hypothetical protein [Kiritimatiellia bacterium]
MTTRVVVPAAMAALVFTLGCDTPAYRIRTHPEIYETLNPDVQEKVRRGLVMPGYSRDAVFLALGQPDRKYIRTTAEGRHEIWSYVGTYTTRDRQRVEGRFRVRDATGRYRTVRDTVWVDVDRVHEYERFRVEFGEDGRVVAFEQVHQER